MAIFCLFNEYYPAMVGCQYDIIWFMEQNNTYNLMNQMTQESKSLWRIKKNYIKEAKGKEMKAFWAKMQKDKESHLRQMKKLLKGALK